MTRARRKSVAVDVGGIRVGGDAPIVVQSMTNTNTEDIETTAQQVAALAVAGSELVRLTINTPAAARAVPEIARRVADLSAEVPIIGDFHYNGHLLLTEYPECARVLAKYRINPGNVGAGKNHDDHFRQIIEVAIRNDKPVRIGVNWGSLDQELLARMMDENSRAVQPRALRDVMIDAMNRSALESARLAEHYGLARNRIILSAKLSGVQDLIDACRALAVQCDYALHLGLTEAGLGVKGIVASATATGVLLEEGIGDTIRVSLTPAPGSARTEEVLVARQILQSLDLRKFEPQVSACPGCGRTSSSFFQEMAARVQQHIRERITFWVKHCPGVEELNIAVMGCVVNGPGESKHADLGISLPGNGEAPKAPVYADGKLMMTLQGATIIPDFLEILEKYIADRFAVR